MSITMSGPILSSYAYASWGLYNDSSRFVMPIDKPKANRRSSPSSSSPSSSSSSSSSSSPSSSSPTTSDRLQLSQVRRRLFDDDVDDEDRAASLAEARATIAESCDEQSRKYNFDFIAGRPLSPREGQTFSWTLIEGSSSSSSHPTTTTTTTQPSTNIDISSMTKSPTAKTSMTTTPTTTSTSMTTPMTPMTRTIQGTKVQPKQRQQLLINHLPVVSRARTGLKRQHSSSSTSSSASAAVRSSCDTCECSAKRPKSV